MKSRYYKIHYIVKIDIKAAELNFGNEIISRYVTAIIFHFNAQDFEKLSENHYLANQEKKHTNLNQDTNILLNIIRETHLTDIYNIGLTESIKLVQISIKAVWSAVSCALQNSTKRLNLSMLILDKLDLQHYSDVLTHPY